MMPAFEKHSLGTHRLEEQRTYVLNKLRENYAAKFGLPYPQGLIFA